MKEKTRRRKERENDAFNFIAAYTKSNHESPTVGEIAQRMKCSSSQAHYYVTALVTAGKVTRTKHKSRGIAIVESPK